MLKRSCRFYFGVVLLLLLALTGGTLYFRLTARGEERRQLTLSVLRSEKLNFLVTRRQNLLVVLEKEDRSLLLGERTGILFGEVAALYGFDLRKVSESSLSALPDGGVEVVLPPPEILSLEVDPASLRAFTKRSGLRFLQDTLAGTDWEAELRREFAAAAREQLRRRALLPGDGELLEELNRWAVPLFASRGVNVSFRIGDALR